MAKEINISSRKNLAWSIIPICVFLIALGVRLPNLENAHSTPKPRPRAVIECSSKSSQEVTGKKIQLADFYHEYAPRLLAPATFETVFVLEAYSFSSITPPQSGARGPPASIC